MIASWFGLENFGLLFMFLMLFAFMITAIVKIVRNK